MPRPGEEGRGGFGEGTENATDAAGERQMRGSGLGKEGAGLLWPDEGVRICRIEPLRVILHPLSLAP